MFRSVQTREFGRSEFTALILIAILNIWDYSYTIATIQSTSEELNPIARYLLERDIFGIDLLGIAKFSMPLFIAMLVAILPEEKRYIKLLLWVAVCYYLVSMLAIFLMNEVM